MRVTTLASRCALLASVSLAMGCSAEDGPCYPSEAVTTVAGELTQETTHQYSTSGLLQVREVYSRASVLLRREAFEYDDRDNLVLIERDRNGDGEVDQTESFGYDDAGNQTSWNESYRDGSDLFFAWVALYDESQNMIQQDRLNADGSIERRITQEFDDDNKLMFRLSGPAGASPDAKSSYFYEDALLVRIETEVYVEGNYGSVETFAYDTQGRILEHCRTHPFDGVSISCHFSRYDDANGKVTEESDFTSDGSIDYRRLLEFDRDLLVSERLDENADGEFEVIKSYEYDSRGNRIREEVVSPRGTGIDSVTETRYRCF